MHPNTAAANRCLQQALGQAAVESFGLSHQVHFLEFRDAGTADHYLSIDTDLTANVAFDPALGLSPEEQMLLVFHRVNLCRATRVACDDEANLFLEFDNGVHLRFAGRPREETAEPWQLASRAPLEEPGGYLLVAQFGGGYAMWDSSATPTSHDQVNQGI
jgi:hypothetical protein